MSQAEESSEKEALCGSLEKIIYRNDANGYAVAELKLENGRGNATICGLMPGVQCGEIVEVHGLWSKHEKHGRQFNFSLIESKLPSDIKGIQRYLGSGLIDGIGKIYAKKIVDHFGKDTFSILSTESARLLEVDGIGRYRAEKIKVAWNQQFAIRDMMIFLQTYEISSTMCLHLYAIYGERAREILETDPYRVAKEVPGIGFKTADRIAKNIGIPETHFSRIDAGILHIFSQREDDGHTCLTGEALIRDAQILLKVSSDRIEARLKNMLSFGQLFEIEPGIFQLSAMRNAENSIAHALQNIASNGRCSVSKIDAEAAIKWAQNREGFAFDEAQVGALRSALSTKLNIITGGPGTGKTTILRALVSILSAKRTKIALCSPTGRATQKLFETTGLEAKTIHRLLQYNPAEHRFLFNDENQLAIDYVVVDEASMLDTHLAASLLRAIPSTAAVMFVGDIDQLPSVGPGNILNDLINSQIFEVSRLNKIFRQEGCSDIVATAYAIRNDDIRYPYLAVSQPSQLDPRRDMHFLLATDAEDCAEKVILLCKKYIPQWYRIDPIGDVQILAPMHKGIVGTESLNRLLQDTFVENFSGTDWTQFRVGDKVIQTKNNYDKGIFNGDLGRILHVNNDDKEMVVRFHQDTVTLSRANVNDISLAYAISIHKSQGSEFPVVIVPLLRQHFIMLQRNLIYTAITRGRSKVFLVGDMDAYSIAVKNNRTDTRLTGLIRALSQSCSNGTYANFQKSSTNFRNMSNSYHESAKLAQNTE
ncbi:MAG: ATP-dependent RecD-like DNA helicase [Puniceicoccales bacterium]|jgi:exodeoxyribonuclease V alpha subunit|nr:ATP-dependent RecD-like DNA helicase [Puniceicoccales bacterium]